MPEAARKATGLTAQERIALDRLDEYLTKGVRLYRWWQDVDRGNACADRFGLMRQDPETDQNYGFIDEVDLGGTRKLPVLGTVQRMLFDAPKGRAGSGPREAETIRGQVREFMLRHFMRHAWHEKPRLLPSTPRTPPPGLLKTLSWCAGGALEKGGWGYEQLFYKSKEDGEIRSFPPAQRRHIVDVREVGDVYEWVVLRVRIFDFAMNLPPFGDGARLSVPFKQSTWVILSPEYIIDETRPEPGVLGRYGWGYSFLRLPAGDESILAYGPRDLGPGFMTFHFEVRSDGEIWFFNAFAANQPERIMNLSLNPVHWGASMLDVATFGLASGVIEPLHRAAQSLPFGRASFDPSFSLVRLANLLTGGMARNLLCISRRQLLKEVLAIHFMDTYQFALSTVETWNKVRDWSDPDKVKESLGEERVE